MDGLNDWLFPSTSAGSIIQFRPLSLSVFYRFDLDPWRAPDEPVVENCRRQGADYQALLLELARLAVPGPDTPWREKPCYFLIDFLTEQHRTFLFRDMPAIRYLLDMNGYENGGEERLKEMAQAVAAFAARLRYHLRIEEEEIFPAILRNDFLLRKRPERDAIQGIPAAARLLAAEAGFQTGLQECLGGSSASGQGQRNGVPSLEWLIQSLGDALQAHMRLELDALYPLAFRLERELEARSHAAIAAV